jgi:formylglycine-generating enzyme required for sulfatase activity
VFIMTRCFAFLVVVSAVSSGAAAEPAKEFTNRIGMKLKLIPPGEFMMGSTAEEQERPQHRVRITKPFYLAIHEVTQRQWQTVVQTTPWREKAHVREADDIPATHVTWNDAMEFCSKLTVLEGKTYRLPTEAEWEYACRAGTTTKFSFGDDDEQLGDFAWYDENAWSAGENYPHPVGTKRPNPWGLYDMHGNTWEWCSDWYHSQYYRESPAADPTGPALGKYRVMRGGGWAGDPPYLRSAQRMNLGADEETWDVGLRVVLIP